MCLVKYAFACVFVFILVLVCACLYACVLVYACMLGCLMCLCVCSRVLVCAARMYMCTDVRCVLVSDLISPALCMFLNSPIVTVNIIMHRYAEYITSNTCERAAACGHLDALKLLAELTCDWDGTRVLTSATKKGHIHVLQWLFEKMSTDAELIVERQELVLKIACKRGHVSVLEWLLAKTPPFLDRDLDLNDVMTVITRAPPDPRILEILSPRVGIDNITAVLYALARKETVFFVPAVVEWCMNQGMKFDANFFHRMMQKAAEFGNSPDMEQFLRMSGGAWRAKYFHDALESDQLSFCQWAYQVCVLFYTLYTYTPSKTHHTI